MQNDKLMEEIVKAIANGDTNTLANLKFWLEKEMHHGLPSDN